MGEDKVQVENDKLMISYWFIININHCNNYFAYWITDSARTESQTVIILEL